MRRNLARALTGQFLEAIEKLERNGDEEPRTLVEWAALASIHDAATRPEPHLEVMQGLVRTLIAESRLEVAPGRTGVYRVVIGRGRPRSR